MPVRAAIGVAIPIVHRAVQAVALPIGFIGQGDYDQLCWAACCAMVLRANHGDQGLLDVASAVTGKPCSADPRHSDCNEPVDPVVAWTYYHAPYSVPVPQQGPIDAGALTDQIVNGRKPVQVFWTYSGGGGTGHVLLVGGWDQASATFGLYDPLRKPQWLDYSYIESAGGVGWWSRTFYAIGNRLG